MGAIAVMLLLAITEVVLQIILTALSMQILYSAAQDAETTSFLRQQASLQHIADWVGFAEDITLVTNKFVPNDALDQFRGANSQPSAIADGLFVRCYYIARMHVRG